MVLIVGILVLRQRDGEEPVFLESVLELSSFSFFVRGTVQQLVTFFARQAVKRAEPGERLVVEDSSYLCHVWVSSTGLAVVVVTYMEYPSRVAFSVGALALREFRQAHPDAAWGTVQADVKLATPTIRQLLASYQKSEQADNVLRILRELEEVKDILYTSMEDLLKRDKQIESTIDTSNDLNQSSK